VTALALLAGTLVALPFWVGRFVPLMDLPQHLAIATVLRDAGDPAWGLAPYYEPQWGELTPYWLHPLALWLLSGVFSVETASRVYLTLYALALPVAAVALCGALGRPREAGLLAAPLVLNTNLYFGFVNYVSALALLLVGLGLVDRHLEAPTPRRGAIAAVVAALLFIAHAQVLAFLLAASVGLAATRARIVGIAGLSRRLLPLVPAAALVAAWLANLYLLGRERPFGTPDAAAPHFVSAAENLRELPAAVAGSFQDRSDRALLGVWVAMFAALRLAGGARRTLHDWRVEMLVALALAGYFLAPFSIRGQWDINQRFAVVAALLALATVRRLPSPRTATLAALALAAAAGLNAARQHGAFDREAGPFDEALAAIPPRSRVMGLMFDARGGVLEKPPYLHFAQYAVVRRGGVAANSFTRSAALPVRLRWGRDLPQPSVWAAGEFSYETQGAAWDVFLARGRPSGPDPLDARPELQTLYEEGGWRVVRRRDAPRR
jgi:hypothetical protein